MNEVLTASLFGVLTLIFWGSSSWLLSHTSKRTASSIDLNLAVQAISVVIAVILLLSVGLPIPSTENLIAMFVVSSLFTLGFLSFLKAASKGPTGVVVPVAKTYPIILLFLSIVLLKQDFNSYQIILILVLVFGVMLTAFEGRKSFQAKRLDRYIELALLYALFFGVANFILNTIVDELSWQILYGYINIFQGVFAILLIAFTHKKNFKRGFIDSLSNTKGLISGAIVTAGTLSFFIGANIVGSVVIIVTIASAEPLVASLLSRIIDKERLTAYKRVGAVMIVSAIVLLNVYS